MPDPLHHSSIDVRDLPLSFFEIVYKLTAIYASICPGKHSIPLFFIIKPAPLILIAATSSFLPYSLTASQPVLELALEKTTGNPVILTVT